MLDVFEDIIDYWFTSKPFWNLGLTLYFLMIALCRTIILTKKFLKIQLYLLKV